MIGTSPKEKKNMKKCHVKPKTIGKTMGVSETVGSSQAFLHKKGLSSSHQFTTSCHGHP
jgi:hypothetical protein